jgi:hypothetical protein
VQSRGDDSAVAKMRLDVEIRRKLLKRRDCQWQAGDHARLPSDQDGVGLGGFGYGGNRGDVAGAAEIFVQRALHGIGDGKRRQKRFGMEQGEGVIMMSLNGFPVRRRGGRASASASATRARPTASSWCVRPARRSRPDNRRGMRAAAFAARPGRVAHQQRRRRHVAQRDAAGVAFDIGEQADRLRQMRAIPDHADMRGHHVAQADSTSCGIARSAPDHDGRPRGEAHAWPLMSSAIRAA